MKIVTLLALAAATSLGGCASFLSPRPPVIEDKVGKWLDESVGTLSTAPDYRVVYVKLKADAKVCAEAPADAGAQFGSTVAAGLGANVLNQKQLDAEAKLSLAVAMKQLFKRSQGVQLYRDASFALCNLYINAGVNEAAYLKELSAIRETAAALIKEEIPYLEKVAIDPILVPVPASAPAIQIPGRAASGV